jgi:(p)ppGpp synthase/HD superfamily hydrolase
MKTLAQLLFDRVADTTKTQEDFNSNLEKEISDLVYLQKLPLSSDLREDVIQMIRLRIQRL